jgi:hypothetical protein
LGLFFGCNGIEHLGELMHIHPSQQSAFAIARLAFLEKWMDPAGQHESLACCENSFTLAGITGGLDRNLVHGNTSLKQKIPPFLVG